MTIDHVADLLAPHLDDLVALRRQLHTHPELSRQEFATTELVAERLRIAGLNPRVLKSGTGLTCDVGDTSGSSAVVAVRADIDALAMHDLKDVPYGSQNPGVAHACGHDVHTTVVLGAGLLLQQLLARSDLPGGVRLLFEPAEESASPGALDIIDEGGLTGITSILGLHCDPKLDVGLLGARAGAITSAADVVEIVLTGPGGHTARPELTVDLVAVAARIALDLPRLLSERATPGSQIRLVFGALLTGDAPNVIPTTAHLRASLRTPDRATWDAAVPLVRDCLRDLVDPTGASWTLEHRRGVPPVVNDARVTAVLADAGRAVLGTDAVIEAPHSWGGDSFAWYLDHVPGSYARLGVRSTDGGASTVDLHAGDFDVDERAIAIGIRVLVEATMRELRQRRPR